MSKLAGLMHVMFRRLLSASHDVNLVQTGLMMLRSACNPSAAAPVLAEGDRGREGGREESGKRGRETGSEASGGALDHGHGRAQAMGEEQVLVCLQAALAASHAAMDKVLPRPQQQQQCASGWGGASAVGIAAWCEGNGADSGGESSASPVQHIMLLSHALDALRQVLKSHAKSSNLESPTLAGGNSSETRRRETTSAADEDAQGASVDGAWMATVRGWVDLVQRVMSMTAAPAGPSSSFPFPGHGYEYGAAAGCGQGGGGGGFGMGPGAAVLASSHTVAALRRSALLAASDLFLRCDPHDAQDAGAMLRCAGALVDEAHHGRDALGAVAALDCLRACVQRQDLAAGGWQDGLEWWRGRDAFNLPRKQHSGAGLGPHDSGGGGSDDAAAGCQPSCALEQVVQAVLERWGDVRWEVRHAALLLTRSILTCAGARPRPPHSVAAASAPPADAAHVGKGAGVTRVAAEDAGGAEVDRGDVSSARLLGVLFAAMDDPDPFVRAAALQSVAEAGVVGGSVAPPPSEWGSKLARCFQDSESIVRRAAVSLLHAFLFPPVPVTPHIPAVLCVPALLGGTRAASRFGEATQGDVEAEDETCKQTCSPWATLLAACMDDVDWEVGLRAMELLRRLGGITGPRLVDVQGRWLLDNRHELGNRKDVCEKSDGREKVREEIDDRKEVSCAACASTAGAAACAASAGDGGAAAGATALQARPESARAHIRNHTHTYTHTHTVCAARGCGR